MVRLIYAMMKSVKFFCHMLHSSLNIVIILLAYFTSALTQRVLCVGYCWTRCFYLIRHHVISCTCVVISKIINGLLNWPFEVNKCLAPVYH